jgi:hypothetical protein
VTGWVVALYKMPDYEKPHLAINPFSLFSARSGKLPGQFYGVLFEFK